MSVRVISRTLQVLIKLLKSGKARPTYNRRKNTHTKPFDFERDHYRREDKIIVEGYVFVESGTVQEVIFKIKSCQIFSRYL